MRLLWQFRHTHLVCRAAACRADHCKRRNHPTHRADAALSLLQNMLPMPSPRINFKKVAWLSDCQCSLSTAQCTLYEAAGLIIWAVSTRHGRVACELFETSNLQPWLADPLCSYAVCWCAARCLHIRVSSATHAGACMQRHLALHSTQAITCCHHVVCCLEFATHMIP